MNSKRRNILTTLLSTGGALTAGLLTVGATPAEAESAAAAAAKRRRGPFTAAELNSIIGNAVAAANATNSPLRSITGTARTTKMHIAIVDREGNLLEFQSMDDAWEGSRDIAIAKARTAGFFSSDENALTSRIVGELSEAHANDGSAGAGPLWGIWASNQVGITGGASTRNGIITFPGGIPLYKGGKLAGGIGVSGDGVDQDEAVALAGSVGYRPGATVSNPAEL
jgi:uncharacterized protein GlcG (DUF336 family)